MMESIIYSSTMESSVKQAVSAAMKEADLLMQRNLEAHKALAAKEVERDGLATEIGQEEDSLDRQISALQLDLQIADSVKMQQGIGFWRMTGAPNDARSHKLKDHWDRGEVKSLENYKNGEFQVRFVTELSDSQKEARAMKDELEYQLSVKRTAKNLLAAKQERLAQINVEVKALTEVHDSAEEAYRQAEQNLLKGVERLPPAHKAKALGLNRVSEAMSQAAKTFMPARAEMDMFEHNLEDLIQQLDDKAPVAVVLESVATISMLANDEDVSTLMVLKKLGEATITDFLLPAGDPGMPSMGGLDDDLEPWLKAVNL